ncbi:MAG: DNA topoisomerase [Candidatus Caldarchaeum sp.]|nr:DNA topoisomerase [Candidatus Caldarchaeum sp.]
MQSSRLLIVAEKASVARAIKSVVSAAKLDAVVVSVRGHMMEAELPEGYEWGAIDPLEIIKLRTVVDKVSDFSTYRNLTKVFSEDGVLVVATDNDSEGELIGYEVLETFRKIRGDGVDCLRMRFNSVDRRELFASIKNLEKGLNMRWVEKARFRQVFDLITGAAFTRLLTESTRRKKPVRLISWGSCQTPTLNFVIEREKEILAFKPQKYWRIVATLRTERNEEFKAVSEIFWDEHLCNKAFTEVEPVKEAVVSSYLETEKKVARPLPMRTDDILRDLTRLTRLSASKILGLMEQLYAEGYISYPRTDTNRYRKSFDFETPLKAVTGYAALKQTAPDTTAPNPRNGSRDDGAHPPIYPVKTYQGSGILMNIWEYIARRFYANAFFEDAVQQIQSAEIMIANLSLKAGGNRVVSPGFYRVFHYFTPADNPIPVLSDGEKLQVVKIERVEEETKPPARLTEADLLRLMEKYGIGTDATRATYPQLIVDRQYAVREGSRFKPTPLGVALIESLAETDPRLVTPETRRMVEEYMMKIEHGEASLDESLEKSLRLYQELLEKCNAKIDEISSRLAESIDSIQPPKRYVKSFLKRR